MAKFNGEIGYAHDTVEDPPESGIWVDQMIEYTYSGDVVRNNRRLQEADKQNSDITISNSISVVADEYANDHIHTMRYVRWAGACWTVNTVDVQRPRLILNLGDIYNGPQAG